MDSQPIKVLLIEDSPVDARLIRGLLERGQSVPFELRLADGLLAGFQELSQGWPHVVVLDLTLPESLGIETFHRLHERYSSVPVVILTGIEDETLAVQAVQDGAQDYLVKGQVDRPTLARALRYAIERKRSAEAIRQLNEELEQRVVERTRELTATNQELEAFCHSVAHDLRTPLRAIDGFSRALATSHQERLDDSGSGYLRRIRDSAQRMGKLIDAMLSLSRVTRCEMRREPCDLSGMAEEIVADLQPTEADRRVDFEIEPGLKAEGDPQLLWVVLENLLGNAWKFSQRRPQPRVEFGRAQVSSHESSRGAPGRNGANTLCSEAFFVRDNGVGFDMAYADKLFGTFERLHSNGFDGLGIGLATVDRILRRHGGRVWANGEVDRGATFYFSISK